MPSFDAILAHPDNQEVLRLLGASVRSQFSAGSPSPFDEGGQLFTRWSHRVPDGTRCCIGISNLLVHDKTSRIFALHCGRLTIAVRTGNGRGELVGETLDGDVDLRVLGSGWELYDSLEAEDDCPSADFFLRAYELAGQR